MDEGLEAAALGFRFGLGLLFLTAALPKLLEPAHFETAVRNYQLLPSRFNRAVSAWLPRFELVVALALLLGVLTQVAAGLAAAALLVFATTVSINLARGRRIDCGCYSSASPRQIGWGLVARDLVLALAGVVVLVVPPRTLAVESLWSVSSGELAAGGGLAAIVVASSVVLVELLVGETIRVRRAVQLLAAEAREAVA